MVITFNFYLAKRVNAPHVNESTELAKTSLGKERIACKFTTVSVVFILLFHSSTHASKLNIEIRSYMQVINNGSQH